MFIKVELLQGTYSFRNQVFTHIQRSPNGVGVHEYSRVIIGDAFRYILLIEVQMLLKRFQLIQRTD